MKKFIAAVAATGLLLVGGAGAASAETLYRSPGTKKVTITAVSAPAGTEVLKARIWVKKGKKTVAKNKATYRAKKGKYKVTTKMTYRTVTVPKIVTKVQTKVNQTVQTVASEIDAACTVTASRVVADNTKWIDNPVNPDYLHLDGTADIRYTGDCTDVLDNKVAVSWVAEWDKTVRVCEPWDGVEDRNTVILRCSENARPGDVVNLTGDRLAALPTYQIVVDGPVVDGPVVDGAPVYGNWVTKKTTRTVRVR